MDKDKFEYKKIRLIAVTIITVFAILVAGIVAGMHLDSGRLQETIETQESQIDMLRWQLTNIIPSDDK